MSTKQVSIKKNFIMNVILTMSSFIFPIITYPYVSRILLPVGTGKVSFVTSVVAYFNMFAQLGIPTYGVRAIAKVRDDKDELTRVAQELLIINLLMSALVYIVLFFAVAFIPRLHEEKVLYFIISSTILLSAIGMEWMYRGLEKYTYITVRSIIFKFIAMIAMFALIHVKEDYVIYGAISVFAASASNVLNYINARKNIDLKPVGNYDFKRHIGAIGTFFAMACATQIYTHLDTVMLGFMIDDVEVGLYNAAVKIKTILVSVVTSLGTVLLPRASYYIEHKQMDEFQRIAKKALEFVFLCSIPMTLYFILFAKQGILFLSGEDYLGSVLPMQIIMPTLVFIGLTNILGIQILVPLGRENVVLYSEIAGAVTDLIINIIFIPKLGAVGAAIGTLAAELVVLIWQYMALRSEVSEDFKQVHYFHILLACAAGILASFWTLKLALSPIIILIISAVCFFATYGLVLILFKEELVVEILTQVLNKLSRR